MAIPRYPDRSTPGHRWSIHPDFAVPADNHGTAAWRRNDDPADQVPIPQGANVNLKSINNIASETGTHIQIVRRRTHACLIWGVAANVAKAKSLLEVEFAGASLSAKHSAKWPKLPSRTPEAQRIYEKELEIEEMKQAFRKDPLPDAIFESIGRFVWPSDVGQPQDIFGKKCQGLDPIRIDCMCYIVWDSATGSFKAAGKYGNVLEAVVRLRATLFHIIARQASSDKTYILHWNDVQRVHSSIDAENYQRTQIRVPSKLIRHMPIRPGVTPRGRGRLSNAELRNRPDNNRHLRFVSTRVKDEIMKALGKMKYYRGNVTLQVRLGTFLMEKFRNVPKGGYKMVEFENMLLEDYGFKGSVTHEIGDRLLESQARNRLLKAKGFFSTQSTFFDELSDVKPVYTAVLTVDPMDDAGFVQLSRSWIANGSDFDEHTVASWCRLEKGSSMAKRLLETCVVDLDDGLAWQFELVSKTPMASGRLSPQLQALGEYHFNIKPHAARNMDEDEVWCEFQKNERGLPRLVPHKKMLHMKIAWEFGIRNSEYTVEVAKTQDVRYDAAHHTAAGKEEGTLFEPRWTVLIKNHKWDVNMAQLANLGLGRGATWKADLETWFPVDDKKTSSKVNGHVEMMEKLFRVQSLIRGEEDGEKKKWSNMQMQMG